LKNNTLQPIKIYKINPFCGNRHLVITYFFWYLCPHQLFETSHSIVYKIWYTWRTKVLLRCLFR